MRKIQSVVATDEKPLDIHIIDVFGALARDYTEAGEFHFNTERHEISVEDLKHD